MKKQILTCLLAAGVSTAAFGQSVFIDLLSNSGALGAASNGLLYQDGVLLAGGSVNVTLWGGLDAATVTSQLASLSGANACLVPIPGAAIDVSGSSYAVPGLAANGEGYFMAQWWIGGASNYADATTANASRGVSAVWHQGTGGGGVPPSVPPGLTGMPSVNLTAAIVPEPSAMVLGALGLASLLVFRRRN